MPPFYSIIIPVFNGVKTLPDTWASICRQTFEDYEVIFVDGKSIDGTLALIEKYGKQHNVKFSSEIDNGIYDAMNKGICKATGKWLFFLGCDDLFANPHVLTNVYNELKKEQVDLIYGNVTGINSKKRYIYDNRFKVLSQGIHHQSVFYNIRLFDELGRYNLKFRIAADYHFTLKVFLRNKYKTHYVDLDIAECGECGLSARAFDYVFFSYHYKFLDANGGIKNPIEFKQCLDNSIYCCLYLGMKKKSVCFSYSNLYYYIIKKSNYSVALKARTLLKMVKWTFSFRN